MACFLACSTLGVEQCVEALRWGLGRVTNINYSHEFTNQTTSWLVCSLSTFGARTNHGVTTLLWEGVKMKLTFLKMRTWESFGTPKTLEFDCKGQNTSHWGVFYIIEKLSKCRCRKWARMGHLDICSTRYGRKKGWGSNCQFDFRPLKVKNWPDPGVCNGNAIHLWKALKESYKFALDLVPIGGLNKKLWPCKVPRVQTGIVLGLLFRSPKTKSHSHVGVVERRIKYYMGEGGGFLQV